jgi:hypothetical protein
LTLLVICLAFSQIFLAAQADNPANACLRSNLKDSAKVGQYSFRSYKNLAGDACLQVSRDGKVIFRRTLGNAGYFALGQSANKEWKVPAIANGTDITGRGHPDMIVSFYTGGAHCCTFHYIFELDPEFKLLATLDAEDGDFAHFSPLDGEPHYYYLAYDWTFAYWRESFAGSPAPAVILQFEDDGKSGNYHLALDKMRRPEPSQDEWKKATKEARDAFTENNPFDEGIGPELWGHMLNLIYSGHSDLAWKLFDEAWPTKKSGKEKFLSDFCSQLKISPYWPDLEKSIPAMPAACSKAPPRNTGM